MKTSELIHSNNDSIAESPPVVAILDSDMHQRQSLLRGVSLYGFRCVPFATPDEALNGFKSDSAANIKALIVDISSDFSDGFALINQLATVRPELPVIAIRGLEWNARMKGIEAEKLKVIQRPFTAAALAAEIEKLLR